MAKLAKKFAELLTEGIYEIRRHESKTISFVQDELGYALGKNGGASIEHWRKGHIPAKLVDIEKLAREIVARGRLERKWLEQFLRSADHPTPINLCDELFPPSPSAKAQPATQTKPDDNLAILPLDSIPEPAPLPVGSRMPLGRNPLFVGRRRNLRALATVLNGRGVAAVSQLNTAAATGLGGIGKTQLASEFVHRYGQYFVGGVFWLSFAEAKAIPAQIAECGGAGSLDLRPDFGNLPLSDQVRLVQAAWQRPIPRLLVFDNCEDPELLTQWRPSSGGCRILVTSRRGDWDVELGVQTLALGVLNRHESLELLHKYRPDTDEVILEAIAEELGDLPLALRLAGNYLYQYRRTISLVAYLEQLRDPVLLLHPSLRGEGISPTGHTQHVGRTFALSYDRLKPDDEIDALGLALLRRMAYFASGEPIAYNLLVKTLAQNPEDPESALKADRACSRLVELGLIETEADKVLRMHRLVAKFVRDVEGDKREATQEIVETVLFNEAAIVNEGGNPMPLLAWQAHLRYITDMAHTRADERGACLCNELGKHLYQIGDYDEAQPYYKKALDIYKRIVGAEHPKTIDVLNNLGCLLRDQGKLSEAQPYLEQALAIRKKVLGEEHPDTAKSYNEVGRWLYAEGNLTTARPYFEQALTISQKVFGPEHRLVADYLNNLGMCLEGLGDQAGARRYLEQALVVRQKALGEDHPRTALSLNNMGYLLRSMEEFDEAQAYYERALAIRQKVFGEEHPDTGESLNNLGELLQARGKLDIARNYLERALRVYENVLGQDHPDTAFTLNNLGTLFQAQGYLEEAGSHLERALAIRQKVLGENHILTALSLNNLGLLRQTQGDLAEARSYLERALAIRQKLLGNEHLLTAKSLKNLGLLLKTQGNLIEARGCFERALAILETQRVLNYADVRIIRDNLTSLEA